MKKLLPIGTVVSLVDGTKKVMITGYSSKDPNGDKVYDYNACIFPEGIMEEKYCLFDRYQIDEIFYLGYEDDEQKEWFDKMESILDPASGGKALTEDSDGKKTDSNGSIRYRTPKEPTRPMSSSEMMAKYGVPQSSIDNIKKGN